MRVLRTILALYLPLLIASSVQAQPTIFPVPSILFPSIQQAINIAPPSNTIIEVQPGTYFERIDFLGKAITVRATQTGAVILDGGRGGTVVTFASGETTSSVLEGIVVRGGQGDRGQPGGIYCGPGTAPLIVDCHVTDNLGGDYVCLRGFCQRVAGPGGPGGLLAANASPSIRGSRFTANVGGPGGAGGLELRGAHPTGLQSVLLSVEITGNTGGDAPDEGGSVIRAGAGGLSASSGVDIRMLDVLCASNVGGGGDIIGASGAAAGPGGMLLAMGSTGFGFLEQVRVTSNRGGSGRVPSSSSATVPGGTGGIELACATASMSHLLVASNVGGSVRVSIFGSGNGRGGPGGLYFTAATTPAVVLRYSTIAENVGGSGNSALTLGWGGPGGSLVTGDPTISHCIHQQNRTGATSSAFTAPPTFAIEAGGAPTVSWSNLPAVVTGTGNIDEDPRFFLPNNGDFRLSVFSPCINRGDPALSSLPLIDFEGDARVLLGRIDMGHDELADPLYLQPGTTSTDSLRLLIDGSPWERHIVVAGEAMNFAIEGPGLEGSPLLLAVQVYPGLAGPMDFIGLPGVHLNSSLPFDLLFGPTPDALFGPATLLPNWQITLPTSPAFANVFVRFQAIVASPNAANGGYAASRGHDVLFL